ncbi:hypothetical protein KSS87_007814 [Heliosperma pusillum]|nr:hypothetical protein KSS87_007814 [Heliosperma pusillum]
MGKCPYQNGVILMLILVSTTIWKGYAENNETKDCVSAVGDPGMQRDGLRVAIESWNQCNEVGQETPNFGSPRAADCFDLIGTNPYQIQHKVTEEDNKLGVGTPIPGGKVKTINNVDLYASEKEVYLGSKCQVQDKPNPWHFWMIMLKNGNFDTYAPICPKNGVKVGPFGPDTRFDCFGKGCMGHPTMNHNYTNLVDESTLSGRFFGTWDINVDLSKIIGNINGNNNNNNNNNFGVENCSFYSVTWEKQVGKGSWNVKSPNFKVTFTLNVTKGGGPMTQFYLMDMGSCWKNNGQPCNGDVTSDVTRYSEMILNPEVESWCNPSRLDQCPPYHTFPNGTIVHRNDTSNFPYGAYHMYCAPGNALYSEIPYHTCDPFSNPQPQEILQILPHPVWGEYGYPTKKGEGWIGNPKTWLLDVGRLSQNLYFYQDPGTTPIKRKWSSIDLGVEVYRDPDQVIQWTVSDFDIIVPAELPPMPI